MTGNRESKNARCKRQSDIDDETSRREIKSERKRHKDNSIEPERQTQKNTRGSGKRKMKRDTEVQVNNHMQTDRKMQGETERTKQVREQLTVKTASA